MFGNRLLNCCQRVPRDERTPWFESSRPRLVFRPRSIASSSEIGRTPGTSCPGTLPGKFCDVCGARGAAGEVLPEVDVACGPGTAPGTFCACEGTAAAAASTSGMAKIVKRRITETPSGFSMDERERLR